MLRLAQAYSETASVRPAARAHVQWSYELLKVSTLTASYLRFMQSTTVRADSPSAVADASAGHKKPTKQDIQAHEGEGVKGLGR